MVWEAGGAGVDQSKEALRIKCKHVYSFASYKTKKNTSSETKTVAGTKRYKKQEQNTTTKCF